MVMVIDLHIRADLDTLSDGDALHAVDADTVSQGCATANFQHAPVKGQQLRPPVGPDMLSQADGSIFRNHHFRIGRKSLDSLKKEMPEMEKLEETKFQCAEAYTDEIVKQSAQDKSPFIRSIFQ
jgi:hypothetical protein